jgi:hypothetical protein
VPAGRCWTRALSVGAGEVVEGVVAALAAAAVVLNLTDWDMARVAVLNMVARSIVSSS